jgi:hypothetical protein
MNIQDIEAEINKNLPKNEKFGRFERFLSRKYKCFIIFIMTILSISEMIYLILQKDSNSVVSNLVEKYFNVTRNLNNRIN